MPKGISAVSNVRLEPDFSIHSNRLTPRADNHKPSQTLDSRSTTLTSPSSTGLYNLRIDDTNDAGDKDVFTFTGQKSQLKKSYVLVFDPSSQQATLEPLSSSYTFNLATKNGKDVSSQHAKIYPKKLKDDTHNKGEEDDLFGEAAAVDNEGGDPDPDNPYDFRHFLTKEKEKRGGGDESDYKYASSPDYRTGTGSAVNTPQFGARTQATSVAPARKPVTAPAPKKRKPAATNPMVKAKKTQPTPSVRLQRVATEPKPKAKGKASEPAASKIKSAEIIHSSDESDGEVASSPARPSPPPPQRQPPQQQQQQQEQHHSSSDDDDDVEGESDDDGGLEIDIPDAHPPRRNNNGLAPNHGLGGGRFRPSANGGPISLESAVNSDAELSPMLHARNRNHQAEEEIDFGDLGGDDAEGEDDDDEDEDHDGDIEPMDIGPPVRHDAGGQHDRKGSVAVDIPIPVADDDEDDLEELMRKGLLEGGDSSEESEEE